MGVGVKGNIISYLLLTSLLLVTGNVGLGHAKSGKAFNVVDSNGELVGQVVGMTPDTGGNLPIVLFKFNAELFPLNIGRDSFPLSPTVFFSNTDCTGQAYIHLNLLDSPLPPSPQRFTAVQAPGHTLYAESGPRQIATVLSTLTLEGICHQFEEPTSRFVVPATPIVDLDTIFTPPFIISD